MTNNEKLNRAKELNVLISPLQIDKITSVLRYNFHFDNFNRTQDEKSKEISATESEKIKELDAKLQPLFKELRGLQTNYLIEYEALIMENGFLNPQREIKKIKIPFHYIVDTKTNGFDTNDPDQMFLIKEVLLFITQHITADLTLINIKTMTE